MQGVGNSYTYIAFYNLFSTIPPSLILFILYSYSIHTLFILYSYLFYTYFFSSLCIFFFNIFTFILTTVYQINIIRSEVIGSYLWIYLSPFHGFGFFFIQVMGFLDLLWYKSFFDWKKCIKKCYSYIFIYIFI